MKGPGLSPIQRQAAAIMLRHMRKQYQAIKAGQQGPNDWDVIAQLTGCRIQLNTAVTTVRILNVPEAYVNATRIAQLGTDINPS